MQEIHILHLEADPLFRDTVAGILRESGSSREQELTFAIRRAATLTELASALEEGCPDLILCGNLVPEGGKAADDMSVEALDLCRHRFPSVPFLFLPAHLDSSLASTVVRGLRAYRESAGLREAQARISRDQANLHALIENTSNAIWSMDLDFRVLVFNSAANLFAMMMYGQPMTVGCDFLEHLPRKTRERWRLAALRVRNQERFREEHRLAWNGMEYVFDISFNPVFSDGLITGMAIFGAVLTPIGRSHVVEIPVVSESMRILVVEDNPVNQMVLHGFLDKLGYAADFASNGLEALEAYRKSGYDLVLMDCRMPVMDGFAAAQAIRGEEASNGGHAWIVAVTADVTHGIQDRCLAAGMDGYIAKPLLIAELKAALEIAARDRGIIQPKGSEAQCGLGPQAFGLEF